MKSQSTNFYQEIRATFLKRGYSSGTVRGRYWEWCILGKLVIYEHFYAGASKKVFMDVVHHELKSILSGLVGVASSSQANINAKFVGFAERVIPAGKVVHEGWKFVFDGEIALARFLDVCEGFAVGGIAEAVRTASNYEQKALPKTTREVAARARVGQAKSRHSPADFPLPKKPSIFQPPTSTS